MKTNNDNASSSKYNPHIFTKISAKLVGKRMLNIFGLGSSAGKKHSSNGKKKSEKTSGGKPNSGKVSSAKDSKGKGNFGKKSGGGSGSGGMSDRVVEDSIIRSTAKPAASTKQEDESIVFLQKQVSQLKLANKQLSTCLLVDNTPREFFWVIQEFKWSQKLWTSDPFSFADRVWSLSFGPTESGDFGFIITLVSPMDEPTSAELQVRALFRMHHLFNIPYERQRPDPIIFSRTAMRSRGFVSFASVDLVASHMDLNTPSRSLKLSVLLTAVIDKPPVRMGR